MSKRDYRQGVQQEQVPVVIQRDEPTYLMPTTATLYAAAEIKAFENKLLAALAQQTMNNVSLLVANEARLPPEGADQYRQIIQEYTDAALSLVLGDEQR